MNSIYVLRVFTNEKKEYGNPVAIMIDERMMYDRIVRQKMALKSRLSEVVFINSIKETRISIYSPLKEIPFAGHALVGTAYFFYYILSDKIHQLNTIGGMVDVWQEDGLTWVRGKLKSAPEWNLKQMSSADAVEKMTLKESTELSHTLAWAWIDEEKGIIRARTFASDWGIAEDEANGSGAMRLVSFLNRDLVIRHGKGSLIHARPDGKNYTQIGGLVRI